MKSLQKYGLSFILAIAMTFVSLWAGGVNVRAEETDTNQRTMEITEDDIQSNAYETYYYSDDISYTYQGKAVSFISETQFETEEGTFDLKNKKTDVTVDQSEDGTVSISLSDLSVPVGYISEAWSSTYGGEVQLVYETDIPGMEEIRSESRSSLTSTITLSDVPDGTYHLTDGTIYEKANEWSPGYDFSDGQGVRTEGFFGTLPDITLIVDTGQSEIPEGYLGKKTRAKVYDDFENDIWLQYQQKELQVGETAEIYPWRTEQIVTDVINNDVARPNFNFEIIKGEDVISLEETRSTEDTGALESGSVDKAVVTAEKPGTAVVQVTYDARDYKGQHWDACSDVNTGYVVFTVGEKGTATITTNEEFDNWQHYDTIYYNEGETTPYTFTVKAEKAESVKVTLNGVEIEGDGNTYTADLENRSNIIGIEATDAEGNVKSVYRIIDARFIEVNVKNKATEDDVIREGDTAVVSFRGVTMPVYKLATIYNPQMGSNATYIAYENETLGQFKGQCSQWDLATENSFEISLENIEAGDYTFSSKGIFSAWWGQPLGTDLDQTGAGEPGIGVPQYEGWFSEMPDFTLHVDEFTRIPAEKITLDVTEKLLYKNETLQLNATVEPKGCTDVVSWSSSDESVASVDENGLVTAKSAGMAIITASAGDVKATCRVAVDGNLPPIEDIWFSTSTVPVFDEAYATARIQPATAAGQKITWKLADESRGEITRYSEDGYTVYVRGLKQGTCTVICVTEDSREFTTDLWFYALQSQIDSIFAELADTDSLTLDNAARVKEIRVFYDALSDEDKQKVREEQLSYLTNAEAKMEQLLNDYREDISSQLDTYKNLNDYRQAQKEEITAIIENAKKELAQASDMETMDAILAQAKKAMDAVKTDAQLKEEEAAAGNTEETPSTEAPAQTMPSTQAPSAQTPAATDTTAEQAKTKIKKAKASGKSVKLKWKKVKDAKKYQIFRANSKNGKYKKIKTVSKKKTTFVDKKVKRNKKYFYKVRSYKVVNGKKVFSSFSKVIAVKVK